ncbi:MAG: carbohydrate ABC transporter permease [Anaerolineae bacterium]
MAQAQIGRTDTVLRIRTRKGKRSPLAWILQAIPIGLAYIVGAAFFVPFFWMVSTALKMPEFTFLSPPQWIPWPVNWKNFPEALNYIPFWTYTLNTIKIAVPAIVGTLLSCTLVAYGFARVRAPGRDIFFAVCLATMMVPWAVTMVPVFIMYKQLGWYGTYLPLIVPHFFGSAYYIFLFRQFFMTIPMELSDAAVVDGCSQLGILRRVILPLAKPIIVTVALFTFNGVWSDYLGPLIFITRKEQYTLALGLTYFLDFQRPLWNLAMAATTVAVLPVLIVFMLAQRSFIEGITLTGIKG